VDDQGTNFFALAATAIEEARRMRERAQATRAEAQLVADTARVTCGAAAETLRRVAAITVHHRAPSSRR
jgi:hypothetical protein